MHRQTITRQSIGLYHILPVYNKLFEEKTEPDPIIAVTDKHATMQVYEKPRRQPRHNHHRSDTVGGER